MYLLDTNAVIGLLYDPKILSDEAHDAMVSHAENLYVSIVTPWEITIKRSCRRLFQKKWRSLHGIRSFRNMVSK